MRLWLWFSILQVGNKLPTVWEQLRVPSVKADLAFPLVFLFGTGLINQITSWLCPWSIGSAACP